ncbi:DUF420 domain-containing protein [Paenibacillus nasutitermitis]|uniref:Membrane protein n=1 Tax=Paenibacillus nasutitermitis TaxID=1652958 RepID=A0A917DXA4_9BACL|nr:membrane protein [Paenibacillus nasutitermitis]
MYNVLPAISTSFILISGILVAIGWRLAVKRNLDAHKKVMIAGAVAALIFFIVYVSRTIFVGNTEWGGPEDLKTYYMIFLFFHITLATVAAVFGITTLTLAFRNSFEKHRKIGRITAVIWLCTAFTGALVYTLLYIMYPGGHTKPVLDILFG